MKTIKIIDLTHNIKENMPVFPGTEQPLLKQANTLERDGFKETLITMVSHTGTHIDAPAHMLLKGLHLDELPIEHFIGKALKIDIRKIESNIITIDILKKYDDKLRQISFLVFHSGWDKYWGNENYFGDFPTLSEDAAKYITQFNIKGIGIDAISIDPIESIEFPVHNILFKKNIISIENLKNLELIENDQFVLSVLPLKTYKADGSPVRAIAIVNE